MEILMLDFMKITCIQVFNKCYTIYIILSSLSIPR